jgi:hypothetical protein
MKRRVKGATVIVDPILLRICYLVEPSPLGTHAFDFRNGLDLQRPGLILIGVEEAIEERLTKGSARRPSSSKKGFLK